MAATTTHGFEMDLVDSAGKGQHLSNVLFGLIKNVIYKIGIKFVRIVTFGGKRGDV